MRRHGLSPLVLATLLSLVPATTQAALQRTGPVSAAFGFPTWYQDSTGLVMDFCNLTSDLELAGGWCLLLPGAIPGVPPEVFPANFSPEHFYWAANGTIDLGAGRNANLTLSVEAAFRSGPVIPGDQTTFGRMRILIPSLPVSGTYTIYHPYGVWTFPNLVAGQKLFYTEDVGVACAAGNFDCALATGIGPFLLPSATVGGAELPPIPILDPLTGCTAAGVCDPFFPAVPTAYPGSLVTQTPKYLTDPARNGPVTGSPLADFVSAVDGLPHNHNTFRIEVVPTGGVTPVLLGDNPIFSMAGRVFEGAIPAAVTVERASYTIPVTGATTAKLDVFAAAFPATSARVPAGAPPVTGTAPVLQFWDAPCVLDAVTLLPIGPPVGSPPHAMVPSGSNYWGQSPPPIVPASVCVAQTNAAVPGGGVVTTYVSKNVEDEVTVSSATWDGAARVLSAAAVSSDALLPPQLSLLDFGLFTAGAFSSTGLPPPATAHVTSSAGGVADSQVTTTAAAAPPPTLAVALNDSVTMLEDCSSLPATACATPQVIAPLANDTLGGAPIVFGPGVTLTITAPPRLGTAVVNLDGTVSYTPGSNVNGTDGFSYTVSVTDPVTLVTSTSNLAAASIVITPVNDAPVALNDTAGGFVNSALTIPVLANDTDPDGPADIVAVANLSAVTPAGPTAVLDVTGRNVIFTAAAGGTYTFTYQAQDTAGVLSALPATVTVTIAAAETITITPPAQFIVSSARWKIAGTDTAPVGSIVTLKYFDGPNAGFVIGTTPVLAGGTWALDIRGVTGLFNPTTAQATLVSAVGVTGATATTPIQLK